MDAIIQLSGDEQTKNLLVVATLLDYSVTKIAYQSGLKMELNISMILSGMKKYRKEHVDLLTEGHPGIVSTKSLSKNYVWWPEISKACEIVINRVIVDRKISQNHSKIVCFYGTLEINLVTESMLIIQAKKRDNEWVEVIPTKHATTEKLIKSLQSTFPRFV
ncbi:hypothetical protein RF11_05318 [Thelohanellus kitauei]|uniref:Integrase zinc-binding domain-containing protein n=1 Tax=Thelohanellus kitauei TaxID=669202 RepID=A0A0C2MEP0_THEKT|nr:hypothetical protein RF11_05318 [Thelohanellus kitauei]